MATVAVSNEIAAPLDRVFQTFTDIEHGPTHVSGIKKLEMMTPGPVHIGTRWLETREVMGRLDTAEMEITAFERNRMYTITHHKAGVRIDTTFRFEPSGERHQSHGRVQPRLGRPSTRSARAAWLGDRGQGREGTEPRSR